MILKLRKTVKTNFMKTLSVQNEIANLENELKLKSMLGRAYFDDEATEMKLKLQELRMKEMITLK